MAIIVLTGMSGTGKSSALDELRRRGYTTVDTDIGPWIQEVPRQRGSGTERMWREDLMDALLGEYEASGNPLFIGGTVWNQRRFYPRFDAIVLLSCPLTTILERVANRATNPFGATVAERDRIAADTAEIEPLLRASATVEIDSRKPVSVIADELAPLAGPATRLKPM